jgi:predicted DNA-binding transcriptional regulator AlpA
MTIQTHHLLSTRDAAQRLGIAFGTLQNMRSRGEGPAFVRIGRKAVRYRIQDLDAYLAQHTIQPQASAA